MMDENPKVARPVGMNTKSDENSNERKEAYWVGARIRLILTLSGLRRLSMQAGE